MNTLLRANFKAATIHIQVLSDESLFTEFKIPIIYFSNYLAIPLKNITNGSYFFNKVVGLWLFRRNSKTSRDIHIILYDTAESHEK